MDLHVNNFSNISKYWIYNYFLNFKKNIFYFKTFNNFKNFTFKKNNLLLNKIFSNDISFTIIYKNPHLIESNFLYSNINSNNLKKLFSKRIKIKNKNFFSSHFNKKTYEYFVNNNRYDELYFKKILTSFNIKNSTQTVNFFYNLFDINFLKKEKIYTKLKYSRVPQYDIVSGGVAAIFAGFLGFLICEKFGFELVDSGDFYFLFMYLVFLSFFSRLYIKIVNFDFNQWNVISLKWFFYYYKNIFLLLKFFFNK